MKKGKEPTQQIYAMLKVTFALPGSNKKGMQSILPLLV